MVVPFRKLVALIFISVCVEGKDNCSPKDQCSCRFEDGREISLWPINSQNSARFQNIKDRLGQTYLYDYNPCTTFTRTGTAGECVKVMGCQAERVVGDPVATAYSSKPTVNYDETIKMYTFTYTGSKLSNGKQRHLVVRLKCNKSATEPSVEKFLQTFENIFTTTLTSEHACPKEAVSKALSIGTILCISFSVTILLYTFVGILLNKFVRKKALSESFPNKLFWIGFPSLVKDGVIFTAAKMRMKSGQYEKL